MPRAAEVGRYADYKNAPLLASFLSGEQRLIGMEGWKVAAGGFSLDY